MGFDATHLLAHRACNGPHNGAVQLVFQLTRFGSAWFTPKIPENVAFSWLVGNGDLHAKNISTVRRIRSGVLGSAPAVRSIEYSPLYDLLNTRVAIRDDDFAIPVNGKRNNLRPRDVASVAERWKGSRKVGEDLIAGLASRMRANLQDVLSRARLSPENEERYFKIVDERLRTFGA